MDWIVKKIASYERVTKFLIRDPDSIIFEIEERLANSGNQIAMLQIGLLMDNYTFDDFPDVIQSILATTGGSKYIIGYLIGMEQWEMPGAKTPEFYLGKIQECYEVEDFSGLHPALQSLLISIRFDVKNRSELSDEFVEFALISDFAKKLAEIMRD